MEFIYRKKAGLNSSTEDWLKHKQVFLVAAILRSNNSKLASIIGKGNLSQLLNCFNCEKHQPNIAALVTRFAMVEVWCDTNDIKL